MKKLGLIIILLSCICVLGCFYQATQTQISALEAYWNSQTDIRDMAVDMKSKGFVYGNNLDDISYYTDIANLPSVTFDRKYGNCYDYTTYYTQFIKTRTLQGSYIADSFETELMLSNRYLPAKWHYISRLWILGIPYEQSNISIYQINSVAEQKDAWYNKGYRYFEVKERWSK